MDETRVAPPWWWGKRSQTLADANAEYDVLRRVDTETGREYYWTNGVRALEVDFREDGLYSRYTMWMPDGRVCWQSEQVGPPGERPKKLHRHEPPWWWGITDQARANTRQPAGAAVRGALSFSP